jgi:hypothetical protein
LQPPTGPLFIPQMLYEYDEPQWNDMDRKLNNSEKNLSPFLFVHLESHVN